MLSNLSVFAIENQWILGKDGNNLLRFNYDTNKIESEVVIDETQTGPYLYGYIHEKDGKLYIFPVMADNIVIYDIATKQKKQICIPIRKQGRQKFSNVIRIGDEVWLLPLSREDDIWVFDIGQMRFQQIEVCLHYKSLGNNDYFWGQSVQVGDEIWVPCRQYNFVMHIHNESYEICDIKSDSVYGFYDMTYDGKNFWLIPVDGNCIICWDRDTNRIVEVPVEKKCNKYPFIKIIYINRQVIAVPYYSHSLFIIDCQNKKTIKYHMPYELEAILDRSYYVFFQWKVEADSLFLFPWKLSVVIEIDTTNHEIKIHSDQIWHTDYVRTDEVYSEAEVESKWNLDNYFQLEEFIRGLNSVEEMCTEKERQLVVSDEQREKKDYGKRIFDRIKEGAK